MARFHFIGAAGTDPDSTGPDQLGNKAYSLLQMQTAGLNVPPALVLDTDFCRDYEASGQPPPNLRERLVGQLARLGQAGPRQFASSRAPLLLSVRSGAPTSMPGMMDTLLNIGLTETTLQGLIRFTGNPRLGLDSYRRLIQSFAMVVHGSPSEPFDAALDQGLREHGCRTLEELPTLDLKPICDAYLATYRNAVGSAFPRDAYEQLELAIQAVWRSWRGERARTYRRLHGIPDDLATAVMLQTMVFGNAGGTSGSGVAFSRSPVDGEPALYMDFLFDAQGEDVVSGRISGGDAERLRHRLPDVHAALTEAARRLERLFGDMQDFEFTIEDGVLYLLQSRSGQRTRWAALRIAVDLAREGIISREEAVERVRGIDIDSVFRRRLQRGARETPLARAIPAGLGVAIGAAALDVASAEAMAREARPVILVRRETQTDDVAGMAVAEGILTAAGARTSHAAVVARQLGKVCLVGCTELEIDPDRRRFRIGERWLQQGDVIALDGDTGDVFAGERAIIEERPDDYLEEVRAWAEAFDTTVGRIDGRSSASAVPGPVA